MWKVAIFKLAVWIKVAKVGSRLGLDGLGTPSNRELARGLDINENLDPLEADCLQYDGYLTGNN